MSDDAPVAASDELARSARALAPGTHCAQHVDRVAMGMCHRCGAYLCGLCAKGLADRTFCEACAERLTTGHGPRAARALVLGLLGVHGLFFLAPVAAVLAAIELTAIRDGQSPVGGRGPARAGLALGLCGIAMPVSVLVVVLAVG